MEWEDAFDLSVGSQSGDGVHLTDRFAEFKEFLSLYYTSDIDALRDGRLTSLSISYSDLVACDPDLADKLLYTPDDMIAFLKSAMVVLVSTSKRIPDKRLASIKESPIRIYNLPTSTQIRDVREDKIDQLIQIEGLVRSASDVKPRLLRSAWRCNRAQCGTISYAEQDTGPLTRPEGCDGCNNTTNFTLVPRLCTLTNAQRFVIQERPEGLKGGDMPKEVMVEVTNDMCGITTAGGHVKITGILRVFPSGSKDSPFFDYMIEGLHIELSQKEYEDIILTDEDIAQIRAWAGDSTIYSLLKQSISPDIKGNDNIKSAIVYQLFGGVTKKKPDGGRLRGEIHILLVTDPSCGKSQMMRYVVRLAPRGIMTSGGGTSKAGLTACCVKSEFNDRFTLEAGAMVMADGGLLACIGGEQLVYTSNGLKQMKHVTHSDQLSSSSGIWRNPEDIIYKGIKKCIKVHLYDGSDIICTPDHKILTYGGWKEAGDIDQSDMVIIPVTYPNNIIPTDGLDYKEGFVLGFALCDMWINERSSKNGVGFSASLKNKERTEYILSLLDEIYSNPTITRSPMDPKYSSRLIEERLVQFSPSETIFTSNSRLKSEITDLFEREFLPKSTSSFEIGFLGAILSTDCSISHKVGSAGIKHTIEISPTRSNKYGECWGMKKCTLIQQLFYKYGVLSTIKGNRLHITSLHSYNRVVEIWGDLIIGTKKEKLYPVEGIHKVGSYDTILSKDMYDWISTLPINFQKMIDLGMASTWAYQIRKKKQIRLDFLLRLYQHWDEILWEHSPKKEIIKNYLMNPVKSIEEYGESEVYDLSFETEHNFWVVGGTVHNCDEFDKMNADDRGAMHEAMEAGTVTINKGGINAVLQARCSVLASANPDKGRFDELIGVGEQIKLPPALLSRFDLIFTMSDKADTEKDTDIANHILQVHRICSMLEAGLEVDTDDLISITPPISPDMFRKYVAYVRQLPPPVLSQDADSIINSYYIKLRDRAGKQHKAVPVTARQMEGMIRLAEASAKIRLSSEVSLEDAERAVEAMDACLKGIAYDPATGDIDWDKMANKTSSSKRDKQRAVQNILITLCEAEGVTTEQSYYTEMISQGYSKKDAEDMLDNLHREGSVTISKGKIRVL